MPDQLIAFFSALIAKAERFVHDTYVENVDLLLQTMLISFGMVLCIWLVEIYYVGWKDSGMKRVLVNPSRSTINDIVMYFIHISGVIVLFAALVSLGVPVIFKNALRQVIDLNIGANWGLVTHLVIYLLILDFFLYWHHRLAHMLPFLWKFHAYHHAAEEFNSITVLREHPLDKALSKITTVIPAVILGIPVGQFPIFITVYGILGYLRHSRIPWTYGWFGRYIVQSPLDHWIHHSNLQEHYDTNFANVFSFWDRVFGTYYKGDVINETIGLEDMPFNKNGVIYDLWYAEKEFAKTLYHSIASGIASLTGRQKALHG